MGRYGATCKGTWQITVLQTKNIMRSKSTTTIGISTDHRVRISVARNRARHVVLKVESPFHIRERLLQTVSSCYTASWGSKLDQTHNRLHEYLRSTLKVAVAGN